MYIRYNDRGQEEGKCIGNLLAYACTQCPLEIELCTLRYM